MFLFILFCIHYAQSDIFIEMNKTKLNQVSTSISCTNLYVFDLDLTLYGPENGFKQDMSTKINEYFAKHNMTKQQAEEYRKKCRKMNKLSVFEFIKENSLNENYFDELSSKYNYDLIKKDMELKEKLDKLNGLCVCFTNADKFTAQNILQNMGILSCFNSVFCMDYKADDRIYKCMPESYEFVEKIYDAEVIFYFDDQEKHLKVAEEYGWITFHVQNNIKKILDDIIYFYN